MIQNISDVLYPSFKHEIILSSLGLSVLLTTEKRNFMSLNY